MSEILVGKNKEQNWKLFEEASSDDLWFHLDSFSSCFVILKGEKSKDKILEAAELCKSNTKYKNLKNLKVIYTYIDNLKKGSDVGEVIIKNRKKVKNLIV